MMNYPYGDFEIPHDLFMQHDESDSQNLFNQLDSRHYMFKAPFYQLQAGQGEEKPLANTGLSLYDENNFQEQHLPPQTIGIYFEQQDLEEPSKVTTNDNDPKTSQLRSEKRRIDFQNQIKILEVRCRAEKGDRFQTRNICKNLHTEIARYLKGRVSMHQFDQHEVALIKQFLQSSISIQSFKILTKNEKVNNYVCEYIESKYYLNGIMASRMEIKAKLTMIKYLECIRRMFRDKNFKAWKKNFKEIM